MKSLAHLQIFGCKAYVHVPQEKRQKLDKKMLECAYLGYSEHKKAFILLHCSSGHLVESRDVHFDESELVEPSRVTEVGENGEEVEISPDQESKDMESNTTMSEDTDESLDGDSNNNGDKKELDAPAESRKTIEESNGRLPKKSRPDFHTKLSSPTDLVIQKTSETTATHQSNAKNHPARPNPTPSAISDPPCCSGKKHRALVRDDNNHYLVTSYGNWHTQDPNGKERNRQREAESSEGEGKVINITPVTAGLEDPISYHDALSQDNQDKWEEACKYELETFKKMEVYEEVIKPHNRKIVGCKWVFRYKLEPDGQIKKYKACLVTQGSLQVEEGINYIETFAPVTKFNSI